MAPSPIAVVPQTPQTYFVQIVAADASASKDLVIGAAAGTKVTSAFVHSDDTVARDLQLGIVRGATFYPIGTVPVAIGAGNSSAVPNVNLLDPAYIKGLMQDADGNYYVLLKSTEKLSAKSLTTVTAAKTLTLQGFGADF